MLDLMLSHDELVFLEDTNVVAAVAVVDVHCITLVTVHDEVAVVLGVVSRLAHRSNVQRAVSDPVPELTADDLLVLTARYLDFIDEAEQGVFKPAVELIFQTGDEHLFHITISNEWSHDVIAQEILTSAFGT